MPRPRNLPDWVWPGDPVQLRTVGNHGRWVYIASIALGPRGFQAHIISIGTYGVQEGRTVSLEELIRDYIPVRESTTTKVLLPDPEDKPRRTAFEHIQADTEEEP